MRNTTSAGRAAAHDRYIMFLTSGHMRRKVASTMGNKKDTQETLDGRIWHIRIPDALAARLASVTESETKRIGRKQVQNAIFRQALELGLAQLERVK